MKDKDLIALIIFVRNPVLGKVKTRLAKDIGDEKALEIYKLLLNHTFEITKDLDCHKFIYYADEIASIDVWDSEVFSKRIQFGDDLGARMYNAIRELFEEGFNKVIIIGSDCLELSSAILEEAIIHLNQNDAVIGPAQDGGYYLLALNSLCPELFRNKIWSSKYVYESTIQDFIRLSKSYHTLPKLNDIDNASDLEKSNLRF